MVHDVDGTTLLLQHLGNPLLFFALLVGADVADEGNASVLGSSGAAPAVLDSNTLLRVDANGLAGVEVDGGIRLRGGLGQRAGSAEDAVREVLFDADLAKGSLDTGQSGRRDDSQAVLLLLVQLLEDIDDAGAGLGLGLQLLDDLAQLALNVCVEFLRGQLEVVLLGERDHHATEVLADEVLQQGGAGVAVGDALLLEDLIGEFGAGLESELLGEDEGVVAVEQDLLDLQRVRGKISRDASNDDGGVIPWAFWRIR